MRLAMPLGGLMGEVWIMPCELSSEEIERDFAAKQTRYRPALPPRPVSLRQMNAHPTAGLWPEPITAENWARHRERIRAGAMKVIGSFPRQIPPLDPQVLSEADCGAYVRRKVSIQVQPDDRMPAYLLIPKTLLTNRAPRAARAPAILCFYGTTSGAGKDTTVGLSGAKPGSPPDRNRACRAVGGFHDLARPFPLGHQRELTNGRPCLRVLNATVARNGVGSANNRLQARAKIVKRR